MSQTITGELRKWHHDVNSRGERCVVGVMYNDTKDIWDDGEPAVIFYHRWVEASTFYLAVMDKHTCVKCHKDEEQIDASKKNNGGSGTVG